MTNIKYITLIFTMIYIALLLNSCATVETCLEERKNGNLGALFNTSDDEFSPFIIDDTMYFTSQSTNEKGKEEEILMMNMKSLQKPIVVKDLPLDKFDVAGLPSFFKNKEGNIEIFFAAMTTDVEKINSDIYHSINKNGKWSQPKKLALNTLNYESHPHISNDGQTLLFTSDRPGGIGGLDIYTASRNGLEFANVRNLGNTVNSESDEKSPYLDDNNNLLLASNGHNAEGYDIFRASYENDEWTELTRLPNPINTQYNELGPAVYKEEIYLTSDRIGGCGGKDIYAFDLCGPVIFEGTVHSESKEIAVEGTLNITNVITKEQSKIDIFNDGIISYHVKSNTPYLLEYVNACNANLTVKQYVPAQCNENKATKVLVNFKLNPDLQAFTFEEYDIPFFVTGYYKPNTGENLTSLKMKFAYNLIGNDDSTKYIENPEGKYDKYTMLVEKALNEAVNYIEETISNLNSKCTKTQHKLEINVEGYADPRPFTSKAVYADIPISSKELGINAFPGNKMDNKLLSYLRAYFTAKYINDRLLALDIDTSKCIWKVKGKGVDASQIDNKLKRRVNISIRPINTDISDIAK